jgi:hypothetical protein
MHRIKEGLKDVTGTRPNWEDIDRVAQKVVSSLRIQTDALSIPAPTSLDKTKKHHHSKYSTP